jgi:hypothetical protein
MNLRLSLLVSARGSQTLLPMLTFLGFVLSCVQLGYGQTPTGLPARIDEEESVAHYHAVWRLNGDDYDGSWSETGVATATLTVKSFTPQSVMIYRTDTGQSVSAGLTAVYTGHISPQGNTILDGKVTWIWPGHAGYPTQGTWTAAWQQLQIFLSGKNVTGASQTVAVGQPIILHASFLVPPGRSIRSQNWQLTPALPIIGAFDVAPQAASGSVEQPNLTAGDTTFYFTKPGPAVHMSFSFVLDDSSSSTAETTFAVAGPSSGGITAFNSHSINIRDNLLEFGNFSAQRRGTPGISFAGSVTDPSNSAGTIVWIQLIESEANVYEINGQIVPCTNRNALDAGAPPQYLYDVGATTADSPNIEISAGNSADKVNATFRMYMLWRSSIAAAIPVPLGFLRWGWDASATRHGTVWQIDYSTSKSWDAAFQTSNNYPEWKYAVGSDCSP